MVEVSVCVETLSPSQQFFNHVRMYELYGHVETVVFGLKFLTQTLKYLNIGTLFASQ